MEFASAETLLHCRIKSLNYFYKSSSFSDGDRVHDKSQLQKILAYVGGWQSRQPLVPTRSLLNVRIFYLNSVLNHLDFPSAKGKKINGEGVKSANVSPTFHTLEKAGQ